MRGRVASICLVAVAGFAVPHTVARGAIVISIGAQPVEINDAFFTGTHDKDHVGRDLVSLQDKSQDGTESGSNAIGGTSEDVKTRESVLLSELASVTINQKNYFELRFNADEPAETSKAPISIDGLMIYTSSNANGSNGTKVYDLDATSDVSLLLSEKTNGLGKDDMIVDLPTSIFGPLQGKYLIVYSCLGVKAAASGGPEVWSAVIGKVPEPALLGTLPVIALLRRRRARRAVRTTTATANPLTSANQS